MIAYKSAGRNNDYLVTLEIDPDDSNTNLSRKVDVPATAKYRCRRAFVKSIEHKATGQSVDSIESNYSDTFRYTIGRLVEVPDYDENVHSVCTRGIHFFKSKEPALYWCWHPKNGPWKRWFENGQLEEVSVYRDDKLEGPYKGWYKNGQLLEECLFRDNKLEGLYKSWYENGQLMNEGEYKNGKLEGPWKEWYEDGTIIYVDTLHHHYTTNALNF